MNVNDVARLMRDVDVDRITKAAQKALQDPKTRAAVARTYAQGKSMYAQLADEGKKKSFGKLARDSKTQNELGALVRSVTATIDSGVSTTRRRSRKVWLVLAGLIGAGVVAAKKLRAQRPHPTGQAVAPERQDAIMDPTLRNGEVPSSEIRANA